MADKRIKGITIEIGGDTKKLGEALQDVNKEIAKSNAELKDLKNALKLDPKNTELLAQKQEVLAKEIKATTDRLNTLKQAQKDMGEYNSLTDEQKENYRALSAEISRTESSLKNLNKEFKESSKFNLNNLNESLTGIRELSTDLVKKFAKVGTAITGALTALGVASIKSYAEYEQLVGGVETLFKESADDIKKYAQNAYKTAGLSANEYMETVTSFSASLIQSLNGDTAKSAKIADMAIKDMSDNANKMGSDISTLQSAYSSFAKQNFTLLDNLKLGYGGSRTEMERLIKDANKVKKANGEMANLSIERFSDMVEAIHIVQEQMGITGTTAKEADSTIIGSVNSMKASWKNLLTAVATDNSDMKKAVDDFIESTITAGKNIVPRIRTAIDGIKKLFNSLVRDVFPKLKREIPELKPLINVFEWFIDHKNLIINAVKLIIGTFAVTKVVDFTTQIQKTFTAITAFATGGTLGAVITGVTALVTILNLLANETEKLTEEQQKCKDEIDEVNSSLDNYANSIENANEKRNDFLQTNMGELQYYEDLYKELQSITDENGKVKEGYEKRAEFITTSLSNAFDVEIEYTDDLITGYEDLQTTLSDVIEAKRAQILIESREEEYNEAKNKRNELESDYETILANNNKLHKDREESLQTMADYLEIDKDKLLEFVDADGKIDTERLNKYIMETSNMTEGLNKWDQKYKDLQESMQTNFELVEESDKVLETSREVYLENKKTIDDYELALGYMADKNYEAIVKIYDDTKSYLGKTDEETYNNYQKAINMQEDYIKQLELNEAGYSQDFIDSEKKRAEENLKNLKEEQLKYKSTAMVTAQNFITAFKEKQAESTQVGKNFMQGVADGISSKSSSVYSLVNSVGYKMLSGLKNALKEQSPSKATREMGQFLLEGLSKGIKDDENALLNQVDELGNSVLGTLYADTQNAMNGLGGLMSTSLNPSINPSIAYDLNYKLMANAMKEALQEVDVELDDRKVGKFVNKVVSEEVFN